MADQIVSGSSDITFQATVVEIRELGRVSGRPVFQIALDASSFSTQAGELLGTLTATARSGALLVAPITAVQRDASGDLWHTTEKPMQPGTRVEGRVFRPLARSGS